MSDASLYVTLRIDRAPIARELRRLARAFRRAALRDRGVDRRSAAYVHRVIVYRRYRPAGAWLAQTASLRDVIRRETDRAIRGMSQHG